jgi:hypothetical protein
VSDNNGAMWQCNICGFQITPLSVEPDACEEAELGMSSHYVYEHSADWVAAELKRVPEQAWLSRRDWLCKFCDPSDRYGYNKQWYNENWNRWYENPWCRYESEYEKHLTKMHADDWAYAQAVVSYRKHGIRVFKLSGGPGFVEVSERD